MRYEATAGLMADQVVELVRDRLRNGHDVIVVGRDGGAEGATGGAPKRARPNGADGGGSGGVRFAGAAGEGGGASVLGAAAASAGTVGDTAGGTAGGGGVDAGAAVTPTVEYKRSVPATRTASHLARVRARTRFVGSAPAAQPAPLAAVGPPADEGGSPMNVADGGEAARQDGALAEGDGAVQLGAAGLGLGVLAGGAVGLGEGAVGAAEEGSTDMTAADVRVTARRYHAGASERLSRGARRKLAKAKKRTATGGGTGKPSG